MSISGLFEVHLITLPKFQTKLFGYVTNLDDSRLIRPRPTCAHTLYGDYPVQPMLTFWIKGDVDSVTKIVKEIESDMKEKCIPLIRTKIEAMVHNINVPNIVTEQHYFEFHFKTKISSTKHWNQLINLITPSGVHLFYNPYSKTLNPIATIRTYISLQDLEQTYSTIKELLEQNGFEISELEREYSVFDSNVHLDKNWLFESDPDNFITTVADNMLFAF